MTVTGKMLFSAQPFCEQTTADELTAFLRALGGKHTHLFSAGTSPVNGFDIPVVLFTKTDLSSASTLEEAAALVRADGRPTVHYQAGIHANEPAGVEGALAMIAELDGEYGETLLDRMNIYAQPVNFPVPADSLLCSHHSV